jgi:hypothetical protein
MSAINARSLRRQKPPRRPSQTPCLQPSDRYLKAEMTENFERSPFRDDVLDLIASAPAEGIPISAVLALPGARSRDAVDHLLCRMVVADEIERCARGRYVLAGTLRRQTAPAAPTPPQRHIEPPATEGRPARDRDNSEVLAALWASRGIPYDRGPKRPATIEPADIDTFCAQVGCLCTKYGLSPPFRLRDLVAAWTSEGIPLSKCLGTIENYLTAHATKCQSGSTDRLFRWVDIFLRGPASSSRPARADHGRR